MTAQQPRKRGLRGRGPQGAELARRPACARRRRPRRRAGGGLRTVDRAARDFMDLPETTPMVPCGDVDLIADQLEHGFDAPSYLRAMDAQGIDAVVLYPSIGLFVPYPPSWTPPASADACRSYNEWIADYCATDASRLAAVGIVPLADVDRAVSEAQHLAAPRPGRRHGPAEPPLRPQPRRPRLRPALRGAGRRGRGPRRPRGSRACAGRPSARTASRRSPPATLSHPMEQMAAMASLMLDGALERHPDSAGRLPRVGHRLAAVLAAPPRRSPRVAGRHRVLGPVARPVGVLRPPVRHLHASPRTTSSLARSRPSAPTTSCGPATFPTPTRSSPPR